MPESSKASIRVKAAGGRPLSCPDAYSLAGPQVEPESSFWLDCNVVNGCAVPRPITEAELRAKFPGGFPPYPTNGDVLKAEIEELIMLARLRDEPGDLSHEPARDAMNNPNPITVEPQQLRLPLSMFLQLRPQPLGAVTNTARDQNFPVINSGRELARYFENETPGLPFRLALNYMLREEMWSPPRHAWIWAALDVTIYSALIAAWFLKWRGGTGVGFRPRPWECYERLDVMYDRVPNSTNSADGARRGLPFGVKPLRGGPPDQTGPAPRGTPLVPENTVPDVSGLVVPPSQPTPGTPRHPAYPSGHSTYAAAAARLLREFFPRYSEQLCRLADNAGIARLWAGIHWRSDHLFGQQVGTAVAELIIDQLRGTGIPRFPRPREADEIPPNPVQNACAPNNAWQAPPLAQVPPCQDLAEPIPGAEDARPPWNTKR